MKQILIILLFLITIPAQAFQDCVVLGDGKLTDISIENNQIVDIYPLITVMNEKNTLIVHPLKTGATRFCVLKNDKNIVMFNIKISEEETVIDEVDGFEIFSLDTMNDIKTEDVFKLDEPPKFLKEINGRTN